MEPAARAPAPTDSAFDWADLRRRAAGEARRLLADPHEAEDAVQEAMVRAWRQRAACRSPEAPEGWMRQITRNEAFRQHGRSRARRAEPLDGDEVATAEPMEELLLDRLFLRDALRGLRREDRRLLLLRYQLDLPDVVIARRLGIAETTVRVRLHRLQPKLRVLMAELR